MTTPTEAELDALIVHGADIGNDGDYVYTRHKLIDAIVALREELRLQKEISDTLARERDSWL